MPVVIISASPLLFILYSLYEKSLKIERDYLNSDGVFFYKYKNNFCNNYNNFNFIHDISVSIITNNINENVGNVIVSRDGTIAYFGKLVFKDGSTYPADTFKQVFKYKWKDSIGLDHSIYVYSNGSVIHRTKLFKFIYKLGKEGEIVRKRI